MSDKIRFGVYELDRDVMELRKHGVVLRLQDQPFRVLALLAGRPGEIVSREELQEKIWGNTFVDFDQSLNKAVNRIREALNDSAGTPQYIETVPRRGYRFIAPVAPTTPTAAQSAPGAPPVEPAQPKPHKPPSCNLIIAALAIISVLAAIIMAAGLWLRHSLKHPLPEARRISSSGFEPALSRDGKLLAYSSGPGDGPPHIMLQQTAGGEAVPVTSGSDEDWEPDFSPDATHIGFYSTRNGGGIYIVSTLGGEPRLLAAAPVADALHFSPSGDRILYLQNQEAFTVSVNGGQPVSLALNQDFHVYGPPLWSPDETRILFNGVRKGEQDKASTWWIAPLGGGQATLAPLAEAGRDEPPSSSVRAWVRTAGDREFIVYSTHSNESWKFWRVGISLRGEIDGKPELVASGSGLVLGADCLCLGRDVVGSVSADGKLVFSLWSTIIPIYQIPIGNGGQKLGPTFQLPLPESGSYGSPSASRDGTWMSYNTRPPGGSGAVSVRLRNLITGADFLLDDKDRKVTGNSETSISPNGSKVIFERDCKHGVWFSEPAAALPCGFILGVSGGQPEQVCERCTPRGFSSDGSLVLVQKYDLTDVNKDRIVAVDLRTRTERDFLSLPDRPLFHAFFSWDDKWVVFKKQSLELLPPSQILIAPMRNGFPAAQKEWIAVTDGQHSDDKPQFSADGNTVYFTSTRDGFLCIWAQRLDAITKHPLEPPFAVEHFHNTAGRSAASAQQWTDLSVARDKIIITLPIVHGEIWMTQMP